MADITRGLRGLTFEGALSPNPGIANRLGSLQETGEQDFGRYENEPVTRFRQFMRDINDEAELLSQMINWRPSRNERMQSQREYFLTSNPSEDIGMEAASAGFGESRFDRRMNTPAVFDDLEDARAREQSTLGVLGNSVAKMGVLAATTAADSWVGLPAGIINLISESAAGNVNSARDAFNTIVSNPVSEYLQGINEKSEDIFRNYQTSEERNRPWWENMFTANFIGDTLIKNAGFTIGAVVGGKAAVGVLGEATGVKEARDAFKGLAAELGLAGKSASEVVELLAKGSTNLEKQAAVKALAESASRLKNAELGLQIAGGLLAGTGEARIEALNGVSELERSYKEAYGNIDIDRAKALMRVQDEMQRRGIDINTPEGRAYYDEQKATIDENYVNLQEQIAHDKAMAANTIFALNVPLLTVGDAAQWGKLMLGGYAIDRSLVKGITKAAETSALRSAAKTPAELSKATRYAVKGNKFTRGLGKFGAASRNVFIEAQEEMNQSLFSATAKAKAMGDTTEFMERLYDPMAVHDTVSWLDATKEGMRQSWLNKEDWVEGFAGGFMGFLGLPSISVRVDEKTGKEKSKLTMEGGIWSPLREQNDLFERRTKLVEALNTRLSSPDFLNYYYGKIGNRHFDSIKEDAVKSGDKKLYEKADHAQLINDAMMFANAGRLQDFIDIVDSFSSVSDSTIEDIKKLFPGNKEIQEMTTSGMRTLINDNVDKMKRQLNDYLKIADNIKTVYGNSLPDEQVAEMTWQTAHLDEIEHDLKTILSHPETSSFISAYRGENADKTGELTDYEVVSSNGYLQWLVNKYKDKKDTANKAELETAINDAKDASYDMRERGKYIDNISALSSDPELVHKRMTRILKQQEELRRLSKAVKAAKILSTTDKLSEFISAMEDLGDTIPDETLADIKREADKGNLTAKEYLTVRDMDSSMGEHIRRAGEKSGATEEEIKQAIDAWNYFKHNSDTLFDLTSKHSPSQIASSVAGPAAINLMNGAIESVLKSRKIYDKIAKRPVKKKERAKDDKPEETGGLTKFNLTGKTLTKKRYDEIVDDLQKTDGKIFGGRNIVKVDLEKGEFYFDGEPASGIIYLYYKGGRMLDKKGRALPVAFDMNGNEINPEDVEKLTNESGEGITDWLLSENFPASGFALYPVDNDIFARKIEQKLPVGRKPAKAPKKDTAGDKKKDAGKKTSPHKFIAPNMDMALLGSDGHAVAEALKSLPDDSELRFGIEEEDGPIYILAGEANIKIGTLPVEVENTDVYSGLAELKQLIREEFDGTKDRRSADGMWVSEKYVNHLREKKDSGFEPTEGNVPLDEIPGFDSVKEPIIMFVYNDKDGQQYVFSDSSVSLSDVQTRANISDSIKAGFAYLLVPSGKKYIPVMLYTQNVNEDTLDLRNPDVTSDGFGKRVSDAIDHVVNAITNEDSKKRVAEFKRWALNTKAESDINSLQKLLHFRAKGKTEVQFYIKDTCPQHPDWFGKDVVMVINVHNTETGEDDWTPIKRDDEKSIRDQIIDTIYGLEFETESGETHHGPIVQINPAQFTDDIDNLPDRIRELVESKMLLTDVKGFDLTMPSYIMDYWSVSQKKFVRPSHTAAKTGTGRTNVTTKKTKKGSEKVVSMEVGGKSIQYNIATQKVKIEDGKWFDAMSTTKSIESDIKKLGFKTTRDFLRTARALAVIADKYGDNTTGEGRIGDRVLLKNFTANKDEGFVITSNGGRFMSASELSKFKDELNSTKEKQKKEKKRSEAKRVAAAREKNASDDVDEIDEDEMPQETDRSSRSNKEEIARIKTIHNIRQAIEHLKKYAPQYSEFLDYISKIGYYDDVLVELVNLTGKRSVRGGKTVGTNRFRFNEQQSIFTNSIVIGKDSFGYQTLMHELVHAFTVVALRRDNELYENIKSQMNFMQDSIGRARLTRELGGYAAVYAFENPYEFIAEFFSNPKLQALAKEVSLPKAENEDKQSLFARIINYIADKLRSLFRRNDDTFYKRLSDTLYSVVDRQIQLQEEGKMMFKTKEEFDKAKKIASGASVNGVVSSPKIPTVEEEYNYMVDWTLFNDGNLVPSSAVFNGPGKYLSISQLVAANDEFSSLSGMQRFVTSRNLYEYNSGTESSLFGVRDDDSGVFIVVRSLPAGSTDYSALIRTASESEVPMIIGSTQDNVAFYEAFGFHPVNNTAVDGKIFMANDAFTDVNLYKIGTTYRPFADILDANESFTDYRRELYSDEEWNKFSELEKYHARKCIGI